MKKLVLVLLLIPLISFGQDLNREDTLKLQRCIIFNQNTSSPNIEIQNILDRVLSVIDNPIEISLIPCDNFSAASGSYKGNNYIVYDSLNVLSSNWMQIYTIAHEIGHHINGHSIDLSLIADNITNDTDNRKKEELEAQKFAGFIFYKLGATVKQLQLSQDIAAAFWPETEEYKDYPSSSKMINASILGYNSARVMENTPENYTKATYSLTTKYFYNATEKWKKKDYKGAIEGYNKALKTGFNPLSTYLKYNTYLWRGKSKFQIQDYTGAIEDFTKILEITTDDNEKLALYQITGEPYLVSEAISYETFGFFRNFSISSQAYFLRGISKHLLNDKIGACQDWENAQDLGYDYNDNIALEYILKNSKDILTICN